MGEMEHSLHSTHHIEHSVLRADAHFVCFCVASMKANCERIDSKKTRCACEFEGESFIIDLQVSVSDPRNKVLPRRTQVDQIR